MTLSKVNIGKKSILALGLLVLASGIFFYQNQKEEIPKQTEIIVAKQYIPENTVITNSMLKKEKRQTDDLLKQKGDITGSVEKIVGKRTVTPLYKEELVNLNRLTQNKDYMKEKEKKQLFVVPIDTTDRALNIEKGSYIDIWLEPTENSELEGSESLKLFEKLKVYDTKTEEYTKATSEEKSKETAITYITLYLTDDEIVEYLNVKDTLMAKRISLYGKNMDYKIVQEKMKEVKEAKEKK